jgi:hypothetical protein
MPSILPVVSRPYLNLTSISPVSHYFASISPLFYRYVAGGGLVPGRKAAPGAAQQAKRPGG